jgi:phenylacetate-CoA ligase
MTCAIDRWTLTQAGLEAPDGAALRDWQLTRLAETVARIRANNPSQAARLQSFDGSLESLPFTWPAELAADPMAFLCVPQGQVARVTTVSTSGTTGPKKRIFFTEGDLERTVDFFALGMTMLVEDGQDALILMGANTEHSIARLLQKAVGRLGVHGRIGDLAWNAEETLEAARTADCLVGLPSELLYLCRMDGTLRPRTVLLSADYVPECVIETLRERWGCLVFTHFGMTETGFGFAVQCAAGEGHHVRHPELLLEVVDPVSGRPLPAGEAGELVITTFAQEAMPLLRYRTGDRASLLGSPCPCGGLLPHLGRVEGRIENDLDLGDGRILSIHRLDDLLYRLPSVRAFTAGVERGKTRPTLTLKAESSEPLSLRALKETLPDGLEVILTYGDASPFARRGKRRIHETTEDP